MNFYNVPNYLANLPSQNAWHYLPLNQFGPAKQWNGQVLVWPQSQTSVSVQALTLAETQRRYT